MHAAALLPGRLLRDGLVALDLPLLSVMHEFGPSQLEVTFSPQTALRAADDMVLCRSAIKQLCRRHGLQRETLPNFRRALHNHRHQCCFHHLQR